MCFVLFSLPETIYKDRKTNVINPGLVLWAPNVFAVFADFLKAFAVFIQEVHE